MPGRAEQQEHARPGIDPEDALRYTPATPEHHKTKCFPAKLSSCVRCGFRTTLVTTHALKAALTCPDKDDPEKEKPDPPPSEE